MREPNQMPPVTTEMLDEFIGDCEAPMGESLAQWHARRMKVARELRPIMLPAERKPT